MNEEDGHGGRAQPEIHHEGPCQAGRGPSFTPARRAVRRPIVADTDKNPEDVPVFPIGEPVSSSEGADVPDVTEEEVADDE